MTYLSRLAALIKYDKNEKEKFICGGSLVSWGKVVTAAHCLHEKGAYKKLDHSQLIVLLGAHNLNKSHEIGRTAVGIEKYYIHENYNSVNIARFNGDIAVLILAEFVSSNSFIRPVCLSNNLPFIENGTVAGWGRQENQAVGTSNQIPKMINIPIVNSQICHNETPLLAVGAWDKSFCAGRIGVSVCDGDSGSGFYVFSNGRYYLKGIVSNSVLYEDCALEYHANYVDAVKYFQFIKFHSDKEFIARNNPNYLYVKDNQTNRIKNEEESWFTQLILLIIGLLLVIIVGLFVWRRNYLISETQSASTFQEQQLNSDQNIPCDQPQLPLKTQLPYPQKKNVLPNNDSCVMVPELPTPVVTERRSIFFGWLNNRS